MKLEELEELIRRNASDAEYLDFIRRWARETQRRSPNAAAKELVKVCTLFFEEGRIDLVGNTFVALTKHEGDGATEGGQWNMATSKAVSKKRQYRTLIRAIFDAQARGEVRRNARGSWPHFVLG